MINVVVANIEKTLEAVNEDWEAEDIKDRFWDLDRGYGDADQLCDFINNYLVLEFPKDITPEAHAYQLSWFNGLNDAVIVTLRKKENFSTGEVFPEDTQIASYPLEAYEDIVTRDATIEEASTQIAELVSTLVATYRALVGKP